MLKYIGSMRKHKSNRLSLYIRLNQNSFRFDPFLIFIL